MDHLIEQCNGIAGAKPAHRTFRIVIVYENLVSAARALRACEFLRGEIGDTVSLEVNVWKIAILEDADSRRFAGIAAAQSDVVIVSTSGREEIPGAFRVWVESWTRMEDGGRPAVFTLFGEHIGKGAFSIASFLRHKTALRGIEFFCHPPLDSSGLRSAAPLQPALPEAAAQRDIDPNEWRPGQKLMDVWTAPNSAFDVIEDFAAHLRARLAAIAPNWNSRGLEEWKTRLTRQELMT
jgi:hypothetical protein